MIQRAESGRETLIYIVIIGGGIFAGLVLDKFASVIFTGLVLGVLLNAFLLVRAALLVRKPERIPLAAIGAIPAGLYDAVKIIGIGLLVRWGAASLEDLPVGRWTWLLAVQIAIFFVAFVLMLNDFLRGAKKVYIDAFLVILLLAFLLTSFALFGWKIGLLSLALTFFYCAFSRPLAVRLAASLYAAMDDGPSGQYLGLPPRALEHVSRELGRDLTVEQMIQEGLAGRDRHQRALEDLLDYCEADAAVGRVIREFQASRESLSALYWRLVTGGAGQWRGGHYVAASAIAYPHTLRYLLEHPTDDRYQVMGTVHKLLVHFERGARLD